ncbi:MAG: hypothetical protein H6738_12640 [Alphaproteobacteria bacterium]|nr:hypothetical protein [Alphaproteobacteria bacterium]
MSRNLLVLVPLIAACAPDEQRPGIQIGDEGAFGCQVLSVEDVVDGAAVIDGLGVSADDAMAGLSGAFTGTGTAHDGATVDPLTLDVGAPVDLAWVETGHDGAPSADCDPYLTGSVAVALDGGSTVAASLDGWVSVAPGDRVLLRAAAPYDEVQGDLEPLWLDPTTLDWTELQVIASPAEGGWDGVAGFTGCNEGDGAECAPPVDAGGEAAELVFSVR